MVGAMHDPWKHLATNHPDVRVVFDRLPGTICGQTDGETIWLDDRLTQAQRRVTLCHETIHIERGVQHVDDLEERRVERLTAERMISTRHLVDALRWHRHPSTAGLAETLWVDESTVRCRLETMTAAEQAAIERKLKGIA